jgi:hypothetical protein
MPSVCVVASAFAVVPTTPVRDDLGQLLVSTIGIEFNADPTTTSDETHADHDALHAATCAFVAVPHAGVHDNRPLRPPSTTAAENPP